MDATEVIDKVIEGSKRKNSAVILPFSSVPEFWRLFKCQKCGGCCDGGGLPQGSKIRLQKSEVKRLSGIMDISVDKFRVKFGHLEGHDLVMNYPCPFYTDECTIYEQRPLVCRAFPLQGVYPLRAHPYCPSVKNLIEELE